MAVIITLRNLGSKQILFIEILNMIKFQREIVGC